MELKEAIRARKSIRGYKPDPVPRHILVEILSLSLRAPSAINIQPWEITVVTGEVLERIKQGTVFQANNRLYIHWLSKLGFSRQQDLLRAGASGKNRHLAWIGVTRKIYLNK